MADETRNADLLRGVAAFAGLEIPALAALYRFCTLKTLAKGDAAVLAGVPVDELAIIVSGRLVAEACEYGRGSVLEEPAFFARRPALQTATALRESLLLTISLDDLIDACRTDTALLEALLRASTSPAPAKRHLLKPERIVLCGGSDAERAALLAGFEANCEVRLITPRLYGEGLPGGITLGEPEAAHWLQEQDLRFDLTVTLADEANPAFTKSAIAEADEIVLLASVGDAAPPPFEAHALETRGSANCRLLLPPQVKKSKRRTAPLKNAFRTVHSIDFSNAREISAFCAMALGKGIAVAAASRGVYAAAILGALEAFAASGVKHFCAAAAGSAIVPAGLVAGRVSFSDTAIILNRLSDLKLWKRANRPDTGLFEAGPIDRFLVQTLPDLDFTDMRVPFMGVSRSLSKGAAEIHDTGKWRGAARAGLVPPGILPPLITDDGTILVSGESETVAMIDAVSAFTPSPILLLTTQTRPLGNSKTAYRDLTQTGIRMPVFRTSAAIDRRVSLESVLCAEGHSMPAGTAEWILCIPVPEGITPLDWSKSETLRKLAFEWTSEELAKLALLA